MKGADIIAYAEAESLAQALRSIRLAQRHNRSAVNWLAGSGLAAFPFLAAKTALEQAEQMILEKQREESTR